MGRPVIVLGPDIAQHVGRDAFIVWLHELPMTMGSMSMALLAMTGVLVSVREKPITSSFGAIFVQYAKTNKSGLNSEIDDGCSPFELKVKTKTLEAIYRGESSEDDVELTYTYFKGITPEEFIAQCDADKDSRVYCDVFLGHDEWAAWGEALGLLGAGSHVKKPNRTSI